MPVAEHAKPQSFDFLGFLDAADPNAKPEARARALDELRRTELARAAVDPELLGRHGGVVLPLGQQRDMVVGSASAGGNLTAGSVEAVAAAARPANVLEQAGAQRVLLNAAEASLPVWTGNMDSSSAWLAENGPAASFSALQTRSVLVTPKAAATRLAFSRKLKKQSMVIEQSLLSELGRAVQSTIEHGFVNGTGSNNQPLGIANISGLSTVANFSASLPTVSELAGMVKKAAKVNVNLGNCSFLINAEDFADMLTTLAVVGDADTLIEYSDGAYRMLGFRVLPTTHISAGTVFFGDFSTARVCYFGDPQVIVDGFSSGKSITGQTEIVLINYCDIALLEPTHIVKGMA